MKRQVVALYWYDIECDAGWGTGADTPPLCVTIGFIIQRPHKRQKVRCFKIASTAMEKGYGDTHIIPEGVVKEVIKLGKVTVPQR